MHLSLPEQFPIFILASSVCKSLQCLISTLEQGSECSHIFRLMCSVVLSGGRDTANKYHWHVWGVLTVYDHTGFASAHSASAFPVYTAQAPGCSAGVLSKAGPLFRALTRSKLLRFRFSGTLQGHRLGWACILCPSQVRGAKATRCLVSTLCQVGCAS